MQKHRWRSKCSIAIVVGFLASPSSAYPQNELVAKPIRAFGSDRFQSRDSISHAIVGPDGVTLFTLGGGRVIKWKLDTGEGVALFSDSRLRNALSMSPDGKKLASISEDSVAIWDAETGKELKRFAESHSAGFVTFRPNGDSILVCREARIEVRRLKGGQWDVVKTVEFTYPTASPDLAYVAIANRAAEIGILNTRTLELKALLPVGVVGIDGLLNRQREVRIGFSPDKKMVATVSSKGDGIAIWDLNKAEISQELKPANAHFSKGELNYTKLFFSTNGKILFVGTEAGTIRRWDVTTARELPPMRSHRGEINELCIAKNGKWLVSIDRGSVIRRWDIASGDEITPIDGYIGEFDFRISSDGKNAIFLDSVGRMDLVDIESGRIQARFQRPFVDTSERIWLGESFGFMPDGKQVFFANRHNGTITTWTAADGKLLGTINSGNASPKSLRFCVPTPDGQAFVVNRERDQLARINARTGETEWIATELYKRGALCAPAFAKDGKTIYCCGKEFEKDARSSGFEFLMLEASNGKLKSRTKADTKIGGSLDLPNRLRFSPDGKRLILDYLIDLFVVCDAQTFQPIHRHAHPTQIAISPDASIVLLEWSGSIEGYASDSRKSLFKMKTDNWRASMCILPDNRHFLTSEGNGSAKLWAMPHFAK